VPLLFFSSWLFPVLLVLPIAGGTKRCAHASVSQAASHTYVRQTICSRMCCHSWELHGAATIVSHLVFLHHPSLNQGLWYGMIGSMIVMTWPVCMFTLHCAAACLHMKRFQPMRHAMMIIAVKGPQRFVPYSCKTSSRELSLLRHASSQGQVGTDSIKLVLLGCTVCAVHASLLRLHTVCRSGRAVAIY
jgi:hypothetical protein